MNVHSANRRRLPALAVGLLLLATACGEDGAGGDPQEGGTPDGAIVTPPPATEMLAPPTS